MPVPRVPAPPELRLSFAGRPVMATGGAVLLVDWFDKNHRACGRAFL